MGRKKRTKEQKKKKEISNGCLSQKSKKEFSLWSNRNQPLFFFLFFHKKNLLYFLLPFTPLALFDLVSKDYSNLPLQLKDHHFLALFTFIHPSFHSFAVLVLVLVLVLLVTPTLHQLSFTSLHSIFFLLSRFPSIIFYLFVLAKPTNLSFSFSLSLFFFFSYFFFHCYFQDVRFEA